MLDRSGVSTPGLPGVVDPAEHLGEERVIAEGAFLVGLRERGQGEQGGAAGLVTLPLDLEGIAPLLDLVEESFDISPARESELGLLRIVQPMLPGRGLDLPMQEVLQMPDPSPLGSAVGEHPVVEVLPIDDRGIEIDPADELRGAFSPSSSSAPGGAGIEIVNVRTLRMPPMLAPTPTLMLPRGGGGISLASKFS